MSRTLCERVAAPLLELHRKTTSPAMVVVLAFVAAGVSSYGLFIRNDHITWLGVVLLVTAWYGFLLSGCERLLAEKDREIERLKSR